MTRYAKLTNNKIEFAPVNYITEDGVTIINFINDTNLMKEYGFKVFKEAEKDPEHIYIITYEETVKQIKEIATIDTEAEQERINQLHMTRGDFFEGFILATGLKTSVLRSYIENMQDITEVEKTLFLNRFDNALDFYRGYPAVDMVGSLLGISEEQLTAFFKTRDYHELMPNITTQQITGLE